jgi:hypothetical protein
VQVTESVDVQDIGETDGDEEVLRHARYDMPRVGL